MDANGAQRAGDKTKYKQTLAEFFDLIPVVGPTLKFLLTHWGGLAIFFVFVGLVVGWGSVYIGKVPEFIVKKYRETASPPAAGPKPSSIGRHQIKTDDDLQPYLHPYLRLLQEEAVSARQNHLIDDFYLESYEGRVPDVKPGEAIPAFEWSFQTASDYDLSGLGLMFTKVDKVEYLRPLTITKENRHSVRVSIPQNKADDRLVVILRATWKGISRPISLNSIVESAVRQGGE